MKILVPYEIEFPDQLYIDGVVLYPDEVHTAYRGMTDYVHYESEKLRVAEYMVTTSVTVKIAELSVYVRNKGVFHSEKQFGNIDELVDYLMRSCDIGKSTKKSQPPTKSFSDMVKKQRNVNNGIVKTEDEDNQWLWNRQDLYSTLIPKIESASSELIRKMNKVRNYEACGDIDTDIDQMVYESIFEIEELLNTLKDDINNY